MTPLLVNKKIDLYNFLNLFPFVPLIRPEIKTTYFDPKI